MHDPTAITPAPPDTIAAQPAPAAPTDVIAAQPAARPLALGPATRVRFLVLAWICALSMITYIDRVCIKQVAPDMQRDLGLSAAQFAWVFSAFALAYSLFEVPTGWLGDRLGPRRVLTRIVLWWSAFTALTGCVGRFSWDSGWHWRLPWTDVVLPLALNSFVVLLAVRFLFGAGEAGAYPNAARALRNWFPYRERGRAQGLLWMFGRFGGALGSVLITALALALGWRGSFLVFGLLGAAWVAGFWLWFRDTPRQHPGVNEAERAAIEEEAAAVRLGPAPPLSWLAMLSSPTLWWLCGMYFCSNAGWCLFITWDVAYLRGVLKLGGWPLSLAAGAPLFCGGIACLLGGLLTDRQVRVWGRRWGRTGQGVIAYSLGAAFFLLALFLSDPGAPLPAVVCLCLASFGKDFGMAASWSTCLDIGHRYSGTVAGFMNMVGNLGTVVSPPVVAWLATRTGGNWGAALYYSAAMFGVAAVCWLFIDPRRPIVYAPQDQ
jgi:ACS family glucarate transporter-like MFS transporter